jgi:hypothetical protein
LNDETIEYRMSDGREVQVDFVEPADGVLVTEAFDAETDSPGIRAALRSESRTTPLEPIPEHPP